MPLTIIDKDKRTVDESGDKDFTPQQIQCLDGLELGRNEVVGSMKHDHGIGHAGGPALRKAIGRKRATYPNGIDGEVVWVPLR